MKVIDRIKDFFRRRSIRKDRSTAPTMMLPVQRIKSMVAVIDVEDTSFDLCKNAIMSYCREMGIKCEIFYFDFRKIGKEDRLITSVTSTVLAKDLNWFGKPSREKMKLLLDFSPDLFLSLIKNTDFPITYLASCCSAKFKAGRLQLPGEVFDLVVTDPEGKDYSEAEVFEYVKKYLGKISDNNEQ